MSIRVTCRECDASYTVSDEMAGRKVRCRECDANVRVPDYDDDDDRPRRRSRKRGGGGMSTGTIVLLIVGGVACVGCIICAGVVGVAYMGAREVGRAIDQEMNAHRVPPSNGKIIFNQQGVLLQNDPFREGKATKTFQVNMLQGKTYVIDLVSTEMDCWLMLYDPGNMLLFQDDDGGDGLNSRIRFTANRSGNHTIGCAALGGPNPGPGGSRFTVTVREE